MKYFDTTVVMALVFILVNTVYSNGDDAGPLMGS